MTVEQRAIITQRPTTALSLDRIGTRGGSLPLYYDGAPVLFEELTRRDGTQSWSMTDRKPKLTIFEPQPNHGVLHGSIECTFGTTEIDIETATGQVHSLTFDMAKIIPHMIQEHHAIISPEAQAIVRDIQAKKRPSAKFVIFPHRYQYLEHADTLDWLKSLPTDNNKMTNLRLLMAPFRRDVEMALSINPLTVTISIIVGDQVRSIRLQKTTEIPNRLFYNFDKAGVRPKLKREQMLILYNSLFDRPNPPPKSAAGTIRDMLT